jgi:putative transposase
MVRIARLVMPGWPHHVTRRGNHRQTVFFNDRHREMYLELIAKYKDLYRITIVGYSLMTIHTHNIPIPELKTSLAKGIGRPHNDYSRWMNIQLNQTGHLWHEIGDALHLLDG